MALVRRFYRWDTVFPDADDYWARDGGRTLVISWSSRRLDGSVVQWTGIANGAYDKAIDRRAAALKAFRAPVFFVFSHEPESFPREQRGVVPSAEFVRAWRRIHARFAAAGVRNVSWLLTLTAYTYDQGKADAWYPGDSYVDVLGADGYNWFGCYGTPAWRSFRSVFTAFRSYGVAKRKPMVIPEWGSVEDPSQPGRKAAWIEEAAATLETWPEIKGALYFHSAPGPDCAWWVDSSASSLDAFRAMGADAYFNPSLPAFVATAPTVRVASGPPALTAATSAAFTLSSSTSGARFACKLDGGAAQPCASGVRYSGLSTGIHELFVQATDSLGRTGDPAVWIWRVVPVSATVAVGDFAFSPRTVSAARGSAVRWSFSGPSDHTATSSVGLWDSGRRAAGSTFTFPFFAAGTYAYRCRFHATMTGVVRVPVGVAPASGTTTDIFRVMWSSIIAPPGYVFDVQIRRPGSTAWSVYKTTTRSAETFTPTAGAGTYSFRSRLRSLDTGKASGYSAPASITVA